MKSVALYFSPKIVHALPNLVTLLRGDPKRLL